MPADAYQLTRSAPPTRTRPGLICSGWKWPADFSPALNPAPPFVRTLSTIPCSGSCAGLRRPRLPQPETYTSLHLCTLTALNCRLRCYRLNPFRLHTDQARTHSRPISDADPRLLLSLAPQHLRAGLFLFRVSVPGCPAPSRPQPSQTCVAKQTLHAWHSAVHAHMPKSPSQRERERSRPGRLNRAFTDRSPEDLPDGNTPKALITQEATTPMSQQERRWRRTPPPFTVYSEVYYCHGTLPQPSPVLDRILQDLLEQQETGPANTRRPRLTLKSRDTSRRLAKAEIIEKHLEAQGDRPPRPRSLPPRPSLPLRAVDRPRPTRAGSPDGCSRAARSRSRPRADGPPLGSQSRRHSLMIEREPRGRPLSAIHCLPLTGVLPPARTELQASN